MNIPMFENQWWHHSHKHSYALSYCCNNQMIQLSKRAGERKNEREREMWEEIGGERSIINIWKELNVSGINKIYK